VSRRRHRDASPDNGLLAAFHRAARSPERWLDTAERLGRVADAVGRLFESDLDAVVAKEPITEHRHAQSGPAFMILAGLAGAVSGPTRWDNSDRMRVLSPADPDLFQDIYQPLLERLRVG
jgi:hypothetical protein